MSRITVNIPIGINGDFEVKKVTTDIVVGKNEPLAEYTILYKNGVEIMQDTTSEYKEHTPLWENAKGDVLIGGLGLGLVHQALLDNPEVTSVTIVEKYQEVVDLVWDHCPKDNTFTLITDDFETWEPSQRYDVCWIDTWLFPEDYETYNTAMILKYSQYCDWVGYWESIPLD